jgi:pantoate--beta-alanine ligase
VQPDEAVFGIKDYQQLAVIRRMAQDLCMPVQISAAPIHREADGLAMSSRNSYITDDERPKVKVLKHSLEWVAEQIKAGEKDFAGLQARAAQQIVDAGFAVDYLTVSNSKTLDPAANDDLEITILGAMFTEAARLIDNLSVVLEPY